MRAILRLIIIPLAWFERIASGERGPAEAAPPSIPVPRPSVWRVVAFYNWWRTPWRRIEPPN